MIKLSKWAAHNPIKSRLIIALCHVLVMANALVSGILLFIFDWELHQGALMIFAILFSLAYFFYPKKNEDEVLFSYSAYWRQKSHDFLLVVSYSAVITLGFHGFLYSKDYTQIPDAPSARLVVNKPHQGKEAKAEKKKLKSEIKEKIRKIKQQIKHEIRQIKKELKKEKGKKGFLIFLTIFFGVIISLVLVGLSCGLACAGHEGLAILVLALGIPGVVLLMVVMIKNITKDKGPKKKASNGLDMEKD